MSPAAAPVAGLVLAAGEGARFGGPKALARLGGRSLLSIAVEALRAGGCEPVFAVVGAVADAVAPAALAAGARPVANPDWASGMGSSLRAGLMAVPAECGAALVLLVDQPLVGAEPVRRVLAAHRTGAVVARASYAGMPGHPVLFAREVFDGVAATAEGDAGARGWLRAHPAAIVDVVCDGAGDPSDADTPAALDAMAARFVGGAPTA